MGSINLTRTEQTILDTLLAIESYTALAIEDLTNELANDPRLSSFNRSLYEKLHEYVNSPAFHHK
jgi:hypothetical protein